MLPFLLEIGTEEIPDWMIPSALEFLREKFDGSDITVDGTGRRLVLRASLEERTADKEEVVTGPPASVQGKPLEGFCTKQGITADALTVVETAKGKYWSFVKKTPGRAMKEILAESLPALITSIPWPKTMYWPSMGGPRFIRPIRWIVALLGNEVVEFECANVKSSNVTFGHRRLGARGPLAVTVDNYEQVLAENFVIVSAAKRRAKIELEVAAVAASKGLHAKGDAKLLEVLTYITEYPTAIIGSFDASYLTLPSEVLVTVMRHHQKYFSVEEPDGELAPHFIAIMNIPADPDGHVVYGNERVLRARFNDARFFYDVDQKRTLADREQDLSHVTFQAKVGNYLEKTARVAALAGELGGDDAAAAAHLCKADLTTEMVKEFTDLQGIVGGLYAKAQGATSEVATAIYEHYKPLSMEDSIPSTREGQALSVADKIDTLRTCFEVGLRPTGSKDPFGLRRAAQAVVRVLAEGQLSTTLDDSLRLAYRAAWSAHDPRQRYERVPGYVAATIVIAPVQVFTRADGMPDSFGDVMQFMRERVEYYFREVKGFKYDEVNAVLAAGFSDLRDVGARLGAVQAVRPTENFEPLAAAFKRMKNIVEKATDVAPGAVDTSKLVDVESALWRQVEQLPTTGSYGDRLAAMATIRPHVDALFDGVMVNDPNPQVRENRLRLLQSLIAKFSSIADFSEIVTS